MKNFVSGKTYIPPSGQVITEEDKEVLHKIVDSGWYTEHKECAKFEKSLSRRLKKKHVHLVNSGSSASLIAISSLASTIKVPFDYVITCATGFPTTVAPIYQIGKLPYYVDIDPYTLLPDLEQVDDIISKKAKNNVGMVVLAHTLGFPFNEMDEVFLNIPLVADCCDALGAEIYTNKSWNSVGKHSDVSTLSFFPAHHITSGEGGAVLTDIEDVSEIVRSLINWGRSCYCLPGNQNTCGHRFDYEPRGDLPVGWDHKYMFDRLGYNLKMTEFQAGLGNSQLSRLDSEFIESRKRNYDYLLNNLFIYHQYGYLSFITQFAWQKPSPFGFPILVEDTAPFTVNDLARFLELHKVGTRRVFGGNLTKQPGFKNLLFKKVGSLMGSDAVMNQMFWIGCQPSLDIHQLNYVLEIFDKFFKERGL